MLGSVYARFEQEVGALELAFLRHSPSPHAAFVLAPERYAVVDYAVIRLLDAWARFCRELVFVSAAGSASTVAGAPIPPSPLLAQHGDVETALYAVRAAWGGRGYLWEPRWYEASDTVKAARALALGNAQDVAATIGSSTTSLPRLLRVCRNFLVHRGPLAAAALATERRNFRIATQVLDEDLSDAILPGGITLFQACQIDLVQRARSAVQ